MFENLSEQRWILLDSGRCEPSLNMKVDEQLLENGSTIGKPVLRFYGWTVAAVSYGFFQKQEDIEKLTPIRPVVRRPTGGGLVVHIDDFTYSLTFPATHPWYRIKAQDGYKLLHQWIQFAFAKLNIPTELAQETFRPVQGQCFQGYEKYDLLRNGRKIAGAAQRRKKSGLLIQGSIQPLPSGISHSQLKSALCDSAKDLWQVTFINLDLNEILATKSTETPQAISSVMDEIRS